MKWTVFYAGQVLDQLDWFPQAQLCPDGSWLYDHQANSWRQLKACGWEPVLEEDVPQNLRLLALLE